MGIQRPTAARWLASVLVPLFTLSLMMAAQHRATVFHGFCSDHGEQIHLVGHGASEPLPVVNPVVREHTHADGSHDCSFLAFLTAPLSGPVVGTQPAHLVADRDSAADALSVAHDTIPLLRLSPKASPPAVPA